MRRLALAIAAVLAALPAAAQRSAVSADLSPELAAEAFIATLKGVCVPAVAGNGVSSLAVAREGGLQPTQDVDTRRQANAAADETVWNVRDALGVVTVRDKAGACAVSVYGPPALALVSSTQTGLSPDFAPIPVALGTSPLIRYMQGRVSEQTLRIHIEGADPGTADNKSQFSVVTATVRRAQ